MIKQLTRQEIEDIILALAPSCSWAKQSLEDPLVYCVHESREAAEMCMDHRIPVGVGWRVIPNDIAPILLGDVLEKNNYDDYIPSGFFKSKRERVVNLWGNCGFSKSLQEIVNKSGYKTLNVLSDSPEYREVLKSYEANQLFSFLQEIL